MNTFLFGCKDLTTSWSKTNDYFYKTLKNYSNVLGFIDYNESTKALVKLYRKISALYFGVPPIRDSFQNFILKNVASKEYSALNLKESPHAFIHTSGIIVPDSLQNIAPHFAYIDATISSVLKYGKRKLPPRYVKHFIKSTNKLADKFSAFFTFNEWTKQSLTKEFGFDETNIFNIGFGANLKPYFGTKDYKNNLILIVLRRGLEESKGLNLLIRAFKIARQSNSNLKLAVVGTTLEKIEGVDYYEGFPREKTIELFQQASLYAMPALMEANGMVYPEALSCKTPILGLNRLAFPEFAGYGKYGFIVDEPRPELISDTILEAMNEPARLEKMGNDGQKFATERYNWDNVANKMLTIIEKYIK